jgi:hypothetical protein
MKAVTFVLLREGSSDDGLIPHLRSLLVEAGCGEASGDSRRYTGTVGQKLEKLAEEGSTVDLVFVHRDADSDDPTPRAREIADAHAIHAEQLPNLIPIIPVHETEAWLLVDEQQIRSVVGRPNGTAPLDLPKIKHIETTSSPKEILDAALLAASETKGRRLQQEQRRLSDRKRTLLERLDPAGPIQQLSAWQCLLADITEFVERLVNDAEPVGVTD